MTLAKMLCDWTTVAGSGSTAIYQDSPGWADLPGCKDVSAFLEVAEVTNAPYLSYQTSPTPDLSLFSTLDFFNATTGLRVSVIRYETAPYLPLSRYVRWFVQGNGTGAFSLTFRIWLACNESGNARRMRQAAMSKRAHATRARTAR